MFYMFRGIDPVFTGTWQTAWRVRLSVRQAYEVQYICTIHKYCLLIDKHTEWIVVDSVVVDDSRDLALCFCFKNLFSLLYKNSKHYDAIRAECVKTHSIKLCNPRRVWSYSINRLIIAMISDSVAANGYLHVVYPRGTSNCCRNTCSSIPD